MKTLAREQLLQKFQHVNNELKEKQWLVGLRFTVADACLFTVTRWAHANQLDLSGLSALNEWFQRVAARPAVAAALKAQGLN